MGPLLSRLSISSGLHAQLVLTRQGREDVSVEDFLRGAPDPPEERSVRNAQQLLREIGALTATTARDEEEKAAEAPQHGLTALGVHLCSLPLSPQLAKMVLWANLLGVGGAALAVVSGLQYREPFVSLGDAQRSLSLAQANKAVRAAKLALSAPERSDHVALWAASKGFEAARSKGGDAARRFCEANCLSFRQMQTLRQTSAKLRGELRGCTLWDEGADRNGEDTSLLLAAVCAGLFPNLALRRGGRGKFQVNGGRLEAVPHPSSVASFNGKGADWWEGTGNGAQDVEGEGGRSNVWVCFNELSQLEERQVAKAATEDMLGLQEEIPVAAMNKLCQQMLSQVPVLGG
ncbi:Ythdc2 [Symbiodinium sp. CCMP2592]|nr:Ythdc2 [Symbiodinium sp. CCMP2592]